ncbi:MAG: GTPase, partial [Clostridium sp.]
MNSTPNANRKHIGIFGKTNSGKSSLINKLVGQDVSIVSEREGTTTDPVQKAMEFLPYGPVLFIDTAGLGDNTTLGELRIKKTLEIIKRIDLGIYVIDGSTVDDEEYKAWKLEMKKYNTPHILVINKSDISSKEERLLEGIRISTLSGEGIETLKEEIIKHLEDGDDEIPIVGDLVPYNGKVVLVVPIDSEAPKGRIILPQVQVIRDCLDNGIKSYVLRDTELEEGLKDL